MNLPTAAVAWAVIVGLAAYYGIRLGYSGHSFALALGVAAGTPHADLALLVLAGAGIFSNSLSGSSEIATLSCGF